MDPENYSKDDLHKRILEENLKESFYDISKFCPLFSVILNKTDTDSSTPIRVDDVDSIKDELEELLKNATNKYKLLNYSIDNSSLQSDVSSYILDLDSHKKFLKNNCSDLNKFRDIFEENQDLENSENSTATGSSAGVFSGAAAQAGSTAKISETKIGNLINSVLDDYYKAELIHGSKYHESKTPNPTKRSNLFKNFNKLESTCYISPDDKNRIEHCERFWSAVAEFVGEIPKDTLDFLKNLSEFTNSDVDLQGDAKWEAELEYNPPFKRLKTVNSQNLKTWEDHLANFDSENIGEFGQQYIENENRKRKQAGNPTRAQASSQATPFSQSDDSNFQNISNFGDLTNRIVNSLQNEGIHLENSNFQTSFSEGNLPENVEKMIDDMGSKSDRSLREGNVNSQVSADSQASKPKPVIQSSTIKKQFKIKNLKENLEFRIAEELFKQGILEEEDLQQVCPEVLAEADSSPASSGLGMETDSSLDDPNNYIDNELKHLKNQLKIIQQHNSIIAKDLHKKALQHNSRHKAFKSLENIDYLLLDKYRKVLQMRNKRKHISKKEKELIYEDLDKRADVMSQLQ